MPGHLPSDFWHFQAKDAITAVIALAAIVIAATNVWVSYLRRHRLTCELGNTLRLSYGANGTRRLAITVEVYAINTGARPGVITRMALSLAAGPGTRQTHLDWTEVRRTSNAAAKGEPISITSEFQALASPIIIPRYEARVVEATFWSADDVELKAHVMYDLRLICFTGTKSRIRGSMQHIFLVDLDLAQLHQTDAPAEQEKLRSQLILFGHHGNAFSNEEHFQAALAASKEPWRKDL